MGRHTKACRLLTGADGHAGDLGGTPPTHLMLESRQHAASMCRFSLGATLGLGTPPGSAQVAGCPPVIASSAGAAPLQQKGHEVQISGHARRA